MANEIVTEKNSVANESMLRFGPAFRRNNRYATRIALAVFTKKKKS
jgi:hypothetical protein